MSDTYPNRAVTERDFRMPEFINAKPEDYEFREDGKIVRKDRWHQGMLSIANLTMMPHNAWEIPDVVDAVRKLVAGSLWHEADEYPAEYGYYIVCNNGEVGSAYYGHPNGARHTGWYTSEDSINQLLMVTEWRFFPEAPQ